MPGGYPYAPGGGGGNVGTAAIQMTALAGARVPASARQEDHRRCRAAGADVVIDYRDPRLTDRVADHAPSGVDVLWDTSGHNDFTLAARTVAPYGTVLVTAATGEPTIPLSQLYTRDVTVSGFVISRASIAELPAAAAMINRMLSEQLLTARIVTKARSSRAAPTRRLRFHRFSFPGTWRRMFVPVHSPPRRGHQQEAAKPAAVAQHRRSLTERDVRRRLHSSFTAPAGQVHAGSVARWHGWAARPLSLGEVI